MWNIYLFSYRMMVVRLPLYNKIRALKRKLVSTENLLKKTCKRRRTSTDSKQENLLKKTCKKRKTSTDCEQVLPPLPCLPVQAIDEPSLTEDESLHTGTDPIVTPQKSAVNFMRQNSLSPSKYPGVTKEITAFHTLSQHIAQAPKKIKIDLLKRKEWIKKSRVSCNLAQKLGINRRSIFSKRRQC
jgi:hypothetical protein